MKHPKVAMEHGTPHARGTTEHSRETPTKMVHIAPQRVFHNS